MEKGSSRKLLHSKLLIFGVVLLSIFFFGLSNYHAKASQVQVISKGNTDQRAMSLTFDVEGGTDIVRVLATLDEFNVKATFFLLGTWVQNNQSLAKMIADRGHEIGNHTFGHPLLTRLDRNTIINDIKRGEEIIKKATGVDPRPLFRPPYGGVNQSVYQAIGEAGYSQVYMWSIDTRDWTGKSAARITETVLNNAHNGGIVLMHVNRNNTPQALPNMIRELQRRNYQLVPVTQLGNPRVAPILVNREEEQPVEATPARESRPTSSAPRVQRPPMQTVQVTVNGAPANFQINPLLINNRTYLNARDLTDLVGGEVKWDGRNNEVTIIYKGEEISLNTRGALTINGDRRNTSSSMQIVNNRAMVPLYLFSEHLELQVEWDNATRTVKLQKN